jgi:hypothetical protein
MDRKTSSPYSLSDELVLTHLRKNQIFQEITHEFSIEKIKDDWNREMDEKSLTSANLTYGEVDFLSLAEIFDLIKTRHGPIPSGGKFYDLGSGSGKAVVGAALLHDFNSCEGIEIMESLFNFSQSLLELYSQMRLHLLYTYPDLWTSLPDVHFFQGDMFDFNWSDASFIFINSTCFDVKMMETLSSAPVNPGTWAVTLTKSLKSTQWSMKQSLRKAMSWGEATVFIHQRI